MTQKERTINELRQVKDSVYDHPNNKDLTEKELERKIYESYINFKAGVENYHEISERAYINTRSELE